MRTPAYLPTSPGRRLWTIAGIGALALIIVAIVAVQVSSQLARHQPGEDREEFAHEATVSFTDQGMVPATLQVKPNTRIYWTNNDTSRHVVVANNAAKSKNADFAGQKIINPGSGYAITLTEPGSYKYYDGTDPRATGEIIVTGNAK
jgi:plastocyanin